MKNQFDEFKLFIKGKKVGVVGIGVSNTPLIKMLINLGAEVVACDKNSNIGELSTELEGLGVALKLGEDYLESILDCEVVFRTPSLMPSNEFLVKAAEKGIYVTSEMAEFMKYCPCKIFGVTGSDGKTTTATLISEMLKKQGFNVFLGGNIGKPLFNEIETINKEDLVVVELSSFQLMDISYSPEVAVITNLSPNHLDIHRDMEEYINAKKSVYLNQDKDDLVILNRDNEVTYKMSAETLGKVRMFSLKDNSVFSYLLEDKLICDGKEVCKIKDIKLPGMHNVANLLTSFCAVYDYVSIETMGFVATTFSGVAHRIEFVKEMDGVRYYNDSIASSPTRTIAGLNSFKGKVILIAGGYDKQLPFEELAAEGIDKIKILVLIGNTRAKIRSAFEKEMKERKISLMIFDAESLEEAVKIASGNSKTGDVIIMSPACASFDMYKNFEIRGIAFKDIVNKLR